ncbi:MAG TPA: PIN domain-containing protein [Pyrinomonadaceae bacterium]|nr:PIN domain-containing protein [Pyrinomonadaceae bacterium]
MAYLLDTGFLYSTLNHKEKFHDATVKTLSSIYEEIMFPVPAITETAYLVQRDLGVKALATFLEDLPEMNLLFETPTAEDYKRAAEILRKYNDANIDFVDACIAAIAERLNITKILTVDRRHFGIFKPQPCESFEILP